MNWNQLGAGLLLLSACGQQAGEDYRGEPLLRMRGQAVISALTGGQAIEPALCFFMADLPKAPVFDGSNIPADLRAELTIGGETFSVEALNKRATHILDVESQGEFPAQFDVEVYLPPPRLGLSAPWVSGESRFAHGMVCAVTAEHPAVTFALASGGYVDTVSGEFRYAIASLDRPRFYYEAYDCPPGTLPQNATSACAKTSAGDPSLAYEFPIGEYSSESVLGIARDFEVVYLEEAVPPGTFTAWQWGAADGLSAGYHLFAPQPLAANGPSPEELKCQNDAFNESERLNNEMFGAQIKEALGDDYRYNAGQAYSMEHGPVALPDDIFVATRENESRLMMEHCPLEPREELDPNMATLSIDIASNATPDLSPRLGVVTVGDEPSGDEPSE